jgi:hypothetical protein
MGEGTLATWAKPCQGNSPWASDVRDKTDAMLLPFGGLLLTLDVMPLPVGVPLLCSGLLFTVG